MKLTFRAPLSTDAETLKLREIDRREIWAMSRHTPEQSIRNGIAGADKCWVACLGEKPVCIFGVSEYAEGVGCPWMLAADEMEELPLSWLRASVRYLREMEVVYPTLCNFIHEENIKSRQWLAWLGFEFGPTVTVNGERFIQFWRHSCV